MPGLRGMTKAQFLFSCVATIGVVCVLLKKSYGKALDRIVKNDGPRHYDVHFAKIKQSWLPGTPWLEDF
jgi:hypothetical protein